jgi:RNA polymerase sigma-70 factor (ECF subfamily)
VREEGARQAAATVFRREAGPLVGALTRQIGNFDVAEESVQDALVAALEHWPREGVPERPGAWLATTARRRAIDRLRREARGREKLAQLAAEPLQPRSDERLYLLFTCGHPSLGHEAQVILTLRAVAGLTTKEIAGAFLTSEATIAQRMVRAKRKVVSAGIPYRLPPEAEMAERLDGVLAVLYLMFNEGYLSSRGETAERRGLSTEAEWLTELVTRLLPREPEPLGLLALLRLHLARAPERFDGEGRLILLEDQDRERWDRPMIAGAVRLIERAASLRRRGPYQIQAAIAAVHAEARSWRETDWSQILVLYGILLHHQDTPVVRLNRAIALRHVSGPQAALNAIEGLRGGLDSYHLLHSTRAELLWDLGRVDEAREEGEWALRLAANPAERELLATRLRTRSAAQGSR